MKALENKGLSDKAIIRIFEVMMVMGIVCILLGIYLHLFNETVIAMGVSGIVISASLIALGLALSIPTKMFVTFYLMKVEREHDLNKKLQDKHQEHQNLHAQHQDLSAQHKDLHAKHSELHAQYQDLHQAHKKLDDSLRE